jgi:Domain of unknown function (DUF1707)
VAGPGDEIAAGAGGRLRASRADREQVIDVLKVAFAQGRLDRDEFDLRADQALAARTYADLAVLTADIPTWLTSARSTEAVPESVNKKAVGALTMVTAALIATWPVMMHTPDGSPLALPVIVVFLVLFMAVPTGWLLLLHDWLDIRAGRQSELALPPAPGDEAPPRRV